MPKDDSIRKKYEVHFHLDRHIQESSCFIGDLILSSKDLEFVKLHIVRKTISSYLSERAFIPLCLDEDLSKSLLLDSISFLSASRFTFLQKWTMYFFIEKKYLARCLFHILLRTTYSASDEGLSSLDKIVKAFEIMRIPVYFEIRHTKEEEGFQGENYTN